MKIYLTDLKAYNSGHLVGEWINLPIEEIELKDKIEAILIKGSYICGYNETHEEYFITDWECEFFDIKEYDNPYELNKKAFKIEELDSEDKSKMGFLLDNNLASNLDDAIEKYQNVIIYKTTTMKEVAKEYIEEHIGSCLTFSNSEHPKFSATLEDSGKWEGAFSSFTTPSSTNTVDRKKSVENERVLKKRLHESKI